MIAHISPADWTARPADWASSGFGWGTLVPYQGSAILTCPAEGETNHGRRWLACASLTTPATEQGASGRDAKTRSLEKRSHELKQFKLPPTETLARTGATGAGSTPAAPA